MSFSIEWNNRQEIEPLWTALVQGMEQVFEESADAIVHFGERAAKDRVRSPSQPPQVRSGRYLQSIQSQTQKTKFQVIGIAGSTHPLASILEFGSSPHIIKAKNRKTLFWPGARSPVKQVNHPGTPAFRVLSQAAEIAVADAGEIVNQAIDWVFE